jgi:hypothetical protein
MRGAEMKRIVLMGHVPRRLSPYVAALLEDASVQLLGRIVEQIHIEEGIARSTVWARLRNLASRLQCLRGLWG